jgi:hypothetical protein
MVTAKTTVPNTKAPLSAKLSLTSDSGKFLPEKATSVAINTPIRQSREARP